MKINNILMVLVVLGLFSLSGCMDNDDVINTVIKHKTWGVRVSFNGETTDGITALCDLLYEKKKLGLTQGYSSDFDNYEFLGYFYSDLHNLILENHSMKGVTIPYFNPGMRIPCVTYKGRSNMAVYFFFNNNLSREDIMKILKEIKLDLEKKWYIGGVAIISQTIALEES